MASFPFVFHAPLSLNRGIEFCNSDNILIAVILSEAKDPTVSGGASQYGSRGPSFARDDMRLFPR